jgi:uncharacterized membrane protein
MPSIRSTRRRGFVLLSFGVSLVVIVAMLGLAVDLGHLYVAKSELQGYADAASVAAAYTLDGTSAGLARATAAAQGGLGSPPNSWNFGSQAVATPQVAFASSSAGPFLNSPPTAAGVVFVQVSVAGSTTPTDFLVPSGRVKPWLTHLPSKYTLALVVRRTPSMVSVVMKGNAKGVV